MIAVTNRSGLGRFVTRFMSRAALRRAVGRGSAQRPRPRPLPRPAGIGIIGSGVAGLHLGLFLQEHDVPVTIYTDKTGDQIASGRLLNTVAHHHHTVERERALHVHHWGAAEYGYSCHHHCVLGPPEPLRFRGDFDHPSSIIDYRLYLPRLMQDYQQRGGELVVAPVDAADVERIAGDHDLMVIAAGRGSLSEMFARRADKVAL
jgi:2-polyprenyl-6-methoxyphenol hydroxylase-like FAD-dependent oxidoreductase